VIKRKRTGIANPCGEPECRCSAGERSFLGLLKQFPAQSASGEFFLNVQTIEFGCVGEGHKVMFRMGAQLRETNHVVIRFCDSCHSVKPLTPGKVVG
jgi:hypothetical protein